MRTNKKRFLLSLVFLLILAACSGEETTSETADENAVAQPVATAVTATEPAAVLPAGEPTADAPTAEPAPTETEVMAEVEAEPAVPEPTVAEVEEAPPAEVQFNGRYETTYFRGAENAPITMIDYSDFL